MYLCGSVVSLFVCGASMLMGWQSGRVKTKEVKRQIEKEREVQRYK